ncbi:uncharacterized protein LOC133831901 [Humulus lupulus]|uniref:uncharacterized protein LOC133831901 n=1 Tax=Humulus lupulus TaxID=3486 RepID=UPI002B411D05|nr:uncharacterized protein LOC133831901 [Humulus lupulus]
MSNKTSNETSTSTSSANQLTETNALLEAFINIVLQQSGNPGDHDADKNEDVIRSGGSDKSLKQQRSGPGENEVTTSSGRDDKTTGSSWVRLRKKLRLTKKKDKPGEMESPGEVSKQKEMGPLSEGFINPKDEIKKLESNLKQMKTDLNGLGRYQEDFKEKIQAQKERIEDIFKNIKEMKEQYSQVDRRIDHLFGKKLWEINRVMMKLKYLIPSPSSTDYHDYESQNTEATRVQVAIDEFLSLHSSESFTESSLYNEIKNVYDHELEEKEKKCLLCFAVFSENEELKKRVLTYWWEGEEYLTTNEKYFTIEDAAGKILDKFVKKHLVEPVYKKRRPTAKGYKMQPLIRSVIINLAAKESFFAYDARRNLKARSPKCRKICLVKNWMDHNKAKELASSSKLQPQQSSKSEDQKDENIGSYSNVQRQLAPKSTSSNSQQQLAPKSKDQKDETKYPKDWETQLETIFNVDEPFPDHQLNGLARGRDKESTTDDGVDLKGKEWLSKMKALKVLYVGTWRASGNHHIQVDSIEFLKALSSMHCLRLLSLQGISRINELTDSIKTLTNLTVLDLKGCQNLEMLPREIKYLRNLTHLDVSDCYMIEHMPRELRQLTNLQVLKGFVVGKDKHLSGKFCAFDDLARMKNLTKLSIFISREDFPSGKDFQTFESLDGLKKLSLSWGAGSETNGTSSSTTSPSGEKKRTKCFDIWGRSTPSGENKSIEEKLSKNLEKLDLQCYPHESTPSWLVPGKLANLKKLYIRGGNLGGDLGYSSFKNGYESTMIAWKFVETLRLKFLAGLKLDWEEMEEFFPRLSYLEKIDCPLVTMCPCDADGVWVKPLELPSSHNQSDHEQEIQEQEGN